MLPVLLAFLLALQATLSVRTVRVALPVTVTDGRGRRVTGLTQDNVRVFESGRPQPVTLFHHGAGAVTLGLVIDHSQSLHGNLPFVTAALAAFSGAAHPDDEMLVVDFNEVVSRATGVDGQPFTSDARSPRRGRRRYSGAWANGPVRRRARWPRASEGGSVGQGHAISGSFPTTAHRRGSRRRHQGLEVSA